MRCSPDAEPNAANFSESRSRIHRREGKAERETQYDDDDDNDDTGGEKNVAF
jgi:hypothetical protein